MARTKLRSRREVLERSRELRAELRTGMDRLGAGLRDLSVVDALWVSEGLGTLLWALELTALPPFDRTFEPERLLETPLERARLRDQTEIRHALASARLWHWRARTALLGEAGELELPTGWQSFAQLIAVAALRGHELGLLPAPLRGDFAAFGTGYAVLRREQQLEALSIAYERHRALSWLCTPGTNWAQAPTDT